MGEFSATDYFVASRAGRSQKNPRVLAFPDSLDMSSDVTSSSQLSKPKFYRRQFLSGVLCQGDRASRFFTVGLAGRPNNTGGQMLRDIDENGGVRVMDDIDYRQERLCGLRVLALGD